MYKLLILGILLLTSCAQHTPSEDREPNCCLVIEGNKTFMGCGSSCQKSEGIPELVNGTIRIDHWQPGFECIKRNDTGCFVWEKKIN